MGLRQITVITGVVVVVVVRYQEDCLFSKRESASEACWELTGAGPHWEVLRCPCRISQNEVNIC